MSTPTKHTTQVTKTILFVEEGAYLFIEERNGDRVYLSDDEVVPLIDALRSYARANGLIA